MELEGTVFKSGKFWISEIPSLNLATQGKTKKEAVSMIADAVVGLIECYFESDVGKDFSVTATEHGKGVIGISTSSNKLLLALSLKRQREKSGSTVREAAARLGSTSPNAYAQYEKGRTGISLEKYDQLLKAVNPNLQSLLRVV